MFLRQTLLLPALAFVAAALFLTPAPTQATARLCASGTATGTWINPKDGELGKAEGKLLEVGLETYVLRTDLEATTPSNPHRIAGDIRGKLESLTTDTVYKLDGTYEGSSFSGAGAYVMRITRVPSGDFVGEISGTFRHKPGKAYGDFAGTFDLCP